jgi:hypothetical protein
MQLQADAETERENLPLLLISLMSALFPRLHSGNRLLVSRYCHSERKPRKPNNSEITPGTHLAKLDGEDRVFPDDISGRPCPACHQVCIYLAEISQG